MTLRARGRGARGDHRSPGRRGTGRLIRRPGNAGPRPAPGRGPNPSREEDEMPKVHLCEDGRWFGSATLLRHADGTVSILDRPELPEVETLDEEPEPCTPEEV